MLKAIFGFITKIVPQLITSILFGIAKTLGSIFAKNTFDPETKRRAEEAKRREAYFASR